MLKYCHAELVSASLLTHTLKSILVTFQHLWGINCDINPKEKVLTFKFFLNKINSVSRHSSTVEQRFCKP